MKSDKPHRLIQDNDCHWYPIPADEAEGLLRLGRNLGARLRGRAVDRQGLREVSGGWPTPGDLHGMEHRLMHVYIAGPYTSPDPIQNVRRAVDAAQELKRRGHHAFVPHLNAFWHLLYPAPYEDWMSEDLAWLAKCDVLLRLAGESPGADREEAHAKELGVPVVYTANAVDEVACVGR